MEDQNYQQDNGGNEKKKKGKKEKKLNPMENKKTKYPNQELSGLNGDIEDIVINGMNLNLEDLLFDEDFDDDYYDDLDLD